MTTSLSAVVKYLYIQYDQIITFCFRSFEKIGMDFLKKVKPMLSDLNTYLSKVGTPFFVFFYKHVLL